AQGPRQTDAREQFVFVEALRARVEYGEHPVCERLRGSVGRLYRGEQPRAFTGNHPYSFKGGAVGKQQNGRRHLYSVCIGADTYKRYPGAAQVLMCAPRLGLALWSGCPTGPRTTCRQKAARGRGPSLESSFDLAATSRRRRTQKTCGPNTAATKSVRT